MSRRGLVLTAPQYDEARQRAAGATRALHYLPEELGTIAPGEILALLRQEGVAPSAADRGATRHSPVVEARHEPRETPPTPRATATARAADSIPSDPSRRKEQAS